MYFKEPHQYFHMFWTIHYKSQLANLQSMPLLFRDVNVFRLFFYTSTGFHLFSSDKWIRLFNVAWVVHLSHWASGLRYRFVSDTNMLERSAGLQNQSAWFGMVLGDSQKTTF